MDTLRARAPPLRPLLLVDMRGPHLLGCRGEPVRLSALLGRGQRILDVGKHDGTLCLLFLQDLRYLPRP